MNKHIPQQLKYVLFLPLLLSFLSCTSSNSESEFYLGGVQINESDYQYWSKSLKKNGFNTVSVTHYAKQGVWNSDDLRNPGLDSAVIHEIIAAKQNGLKVVLILRTALDHAHPENDFLWHGMIAPKNDSLLNSWFRKYEDFVMMWAKEAEKLEVDILGIGSELKEIVATRAVDGTSGLKEEYTSFEKWQYKSKGLILEHQDEIEQNHLWNRRGNQFENLEDFLDQKAQANVEWCKLRCPDSTQETVHEVNVYRKQLDTHWRRIIEHTRTIYSGKLTYAANFDNYKRVGFWDALDFIGINAYFRLRELESNLPVSEEIFQSWSRELEQIREFKKKMKIQDKPVVFTELGFTYRENSTICPWAHDEFSVVEYQDSTKLFIWYEQKPDLQERAIAIEQLAKALENFDENFFKGALYWKLSTDSLHRQYEEFMVWIGDGTQDPILKPLNSLKK